MKTLSMKHLLRGLAACALLCCTALAGAAQPAPAVAKKARIEKAIRYELPPEKGAEQQGDESWLAARSPSFKPTSRQQLLMDAVAKALDDGAFHNTDINEHVAKTLGVTTEQRARNSLNVQGGDFGYDVYNARHAVEGRGARLSLLPRSRPAAAGA